MKPEFKEYLESISLSTVMYEAIVKNYDALNLVVNVEFEDIHFSEKISSGGNREYFSLWAFTPKLICKITVGNIANNDNRIVIFKGGENIARFNVNDFNYDLINPIETSILDCTIRTFDMDIPFGIYASGNNCNNLIKLIKKYIITNE
ncbi:hypothetical protein EQG63_12065 [Flavobacterium amnicola]|uniref:Uncharacterized protein n=1 Tax=Flavobacterium amnicola TaxID=2506422 RepID=A0A4Q1K0Z3_9FLAO|nr:hypothetical protein [Flavobacterium amnicola]RXR15968.1 hypothetical protein EQG63_12065 [Flavobacterium amnicola]